MDVLVNKEHFFRGHRLQRMLQDDADDAACESEMQTIYTDRGFMRTLIKIGMDCPPEIEMTNTSFSMTEDYSDCDEEGAFEEACTGLAGVVADVPDVSAGCSLDYEGTTYTSSYDMVDGAMCVGASCSTEYDAAEAKETADETAAQMETEIAGILGIFGIEGTVACDVSIGGEEAAGSTRAGDNGESMTSRESDAPRWRAADDADWPTCKSERVFSCDACVNRFCAAQEAVRDAGLAYRVECARYSGDEGGSLSCTCTAAFDRKNVLAKCANTHADAVKRVGLRAA
jgi:hypothetical protein